tara:strand:- start:1019 stop:1297 length:279 start_codon:yes stop_codon:yes gene_type:complete
MGKKIEVTTTVIFYAFRYALGRKTGAPSTISEAITRNIDAFAEWELKQIVKEILEFEDFYKELGDECDKVVWYDLIDTINDKLKKNDTKQTK